VFFNLLYRQSEKSTKSIPVTESFVTRGSRPAE